MARVFVSHASADRRIAAQVCAWLTEDAHEVFLDHDLIDGIMAGDEWEQRLHERLRWADALLCVLTPEYVKSTWCTAELAVARSRGCRIVPVYVDGDVTSPLLASIQRIDASSDDEGARERLLSALRRLGDVNGRGWPDGRSPFPGLRSFDVDEHLAFFGRQHDVDRIAELLRSPAQRAEASVVVVVGPSGCGKSSIVRAGLLPTMSRDPEWWVVPPVLPGHDPVGALVHELTRAARKLGLDWRPTDVFQRINDDGLAVLTGELLLAAGHRRRRLLIVVDQLEEILTRATPSAREHLGEVLGPALGDAVHVVATLRPEYLDPLLGSPELAGLHLQPQTVRPLQRDSLRRVIEGPCELAGLHIDKELVSRLVDETGSGQALPLLAYTLAELTAASRRGDRLLPARYEQLGGVRAALARQADAALVDAVARGRRNRAAVLGELLRLVTVDESGRPARARIAREMFSTTALAELDCFVARRLLATDEENDFVVMAVTHEAFLSSWPPLADAISAASVGLRAGRQVEQAADDWEAQRCPPALLWGRGQLAAALSATGLRGRSVHKITLSDRARRFLETSARRDRRRRRRLTTVLSVLLVLALVGGGVAVWENDQVNKQRDDAVVSQVTVEAQQQRDVDIALAAQLGVAGYRMRPTPELGSILTNTSNAALSTAVAAHTGTVRGVDFDPTGHLLVTAGDDGRVRLWDASTRPPGLRAELSEQGVAVNAVTFSPDGRRVAAGDDQGGIRVWDLSTSGQPAGSAHVLSAHTKMVGHLAFTPDGGGLVSAGFDGRVLVWHLAASPVTWSALPTDASHLVSAVAVSPDGRTVALGNGAGTFELWDISGPNGPTMRSRQPAAHDGNILDVKFSPDGRTLASGGPDQTLRLWNVTDPGHVALWRPPLTGHTDYVNAVTFSPDGRTLATAGGDRIIRLWNVADPSAAVPLGPVLTGHTNFVAAVAFGADGRTLASGSGDGSVRLWDVPASFRPGRTDFNGVFSTALAVSPDGSTLATGSADHLVRLWRLAEPDLPRPLAELPGHEGYVDAATFSPDGSFLASGSYDGTVRLWRVTDAAHPEPVGEPLSTGADTIVYTVAFSPDGRLLAVGDTNGFAHMWDVTDPARPRPSGPPLQAHSDSVNMLAFDRTGRVLATASGDSTVQLWDVGDSGRPVPLGEPLRAHTNFVNSVAFSPDGATLATGSADQKVMLWDVTNPVRPRLRSDLEDNRQAVFTVAFSPDGQWLASGSKDGAVRIWNVVDPEHPVTWGPPLTGHTDAANAVRFTPDSRTLVTGSRDQTVRLWDLDAGRVTTRICSSTSGAMTPERWKQYVSATLPYQPPCV